MTIGQFVHPVGGEGEYRGLIGGIVQLASLEHNFN